uniref:Small nuclear RNA activating complex polypeptide 1 n=1 Tax=Sphenodon punctatus TaxID=8508 RepID=A0A8D0H200_SPHPU
EALALVWRYFLPPYTFQIRVGSLYLLYGLYSTQLCEPKQKIRIALKDWPEVHRFQQDLLHAQHYDAAYIFRKLLLDKAYYFTAMPKLLTYRSKKKIWDTQLKEEFKEPNNRVARLVTTDVLEEMMNVHEHYQKMKCLISTDKSQPDKALSLIKDEFVINLKNTVLEYQQWQKDKMVGGFIEGSERAMALSKIKSKSYSAVVQASKSRRHRQVKLESSESSSDQGKTNSPRGKGNRKSTRSAAKTGSLETKDVTQAVKKENVSRSLSMPVITEEEDSTGNDSSGDEGMTDTN